MSSTKTYYSGELPLCVLLLLQALSLTLLSLALSLLTGNDVKSILLNIATTVLFFLPFALYFSKDDTQRQISVAVTVGGLVIGLGYPPMGWKRPHPYSDQDHNRLKIN